MTRITFERIPEEIVQIHARLQSIEQMLLDLINGKEEENRLIDIYEAAEFLNLSISTIYSKVCRKELPAHKPGKKLFFDRNELKQYQRSGRKRTTSETFAHINATLGNRKKRPATRR